MWAAAEDFRAYFIASRGTVDSAASYLAYLRKLDRVCGGLDQRLRESSISDLLEWTDRQADAVFGDRKSASNVRSALRCYADFLSERRTGKTSATAATGPRSKSVVDLLREAKALAVRYYKLTGKPLGVTGEVAELEAAEKLGLALSVARTPGYDAIKVVGNATRRIQIKGRAVDPDRRYVGRCPAIKCGDKFDDVILVLLDRTSLDAIEIWQTDEASVVARLAVPGSKSRNERQSMGISQFKSIAVKVWP